MPRRRLVVSFRQSIARELRRSVLPNIVRFSPVGGSAVSFLQMRQFLHKHYVPGCPDGGIRWCCNGLQHQVTAIEVIVNIVGNEPRLEVSGVADGGRSPGDVQILIAMLADINRWRDGW